MRMYNNFLHQIINDLGNGITYDNQLTKYVNESGMLDGKTNFLGTFTQDIKLPNRNCAAIINTSTKNEDGVHWCGIWKENGQVYFFDSFGRSPSEITSMFNESEYGGLLYDDTVTQHMKENNCGQRCIAWLFCCSRVGPKEAVKI